MTKLKEVSFTVTETKVYEVVMNGEKDSLPKNSQEIADLSVELKNEFNLDNFNNKILISNEMKVEDIKFIDGE